MALVTSPRYGIWRSRLSRMGHGRRRISGQLSRARPGLERLEERTLLSTFTVTDNSDDPADKGSLRYAILNAPSGSIINFAPTVTGTITLTHGTLEINTNLDIEGPDADSLTIDGNKASLVFVVASIATATIADVTIADGSGTSGGGGIDSQGT